MKNTFRFFAIFFSAFSSLTIAQAQGLVGAGTTPADKIFREAKITAPYWAGKVALRLDIITGDSATPQLARDFLSSDGVIDRIAQDVTASEHIYDLRLGVPGSVENSVCALTNNPNEASLDVIRIFLPTCERFFGDRAVEYGIKVLLHESMHHLLRDQALREQHGIVFTGTAEQRYWQEEQFCEDAANAIARAWEALKADEAPLWEDLSGVDAPAPRAYHSSAWTGFTEEASIRRRLIIWGGCQERPHGLSDCGSYFDDGGIYSVDEGTWTPIAQQGQGYWPSARAHHVSQWLDGEGALANHLFVWGGCSGDEACNDYHGDGGLFDPATRSWRALAAPPAGFAPRAYATSVWTGREILVWGGRTLGSDGRRVSLRDGAAYNPVTNTWRLLPPAPSGVHERIEHAAAFGDSRMLIWGGCRASAIWFCEQEYADGALYDIDTNEWTYVPDSALAGVRYLHSVTWIPNLGRFWIWGGKRGDRYLANGAAFDPATLVWSALPSAATPRAGHRALWTGSQLVVAGGLNGVDSYQTELSALTMSESGRPAWTILRSGDAAVGTTGQSLDWTGSYLLIWGGQADRRSFVDLGFLYKPLGVPDLRR